jgi:hypothetical protein
VARKPTNRASDRGSGETAASADDDNRQTIDQDLGIGARIKREECTAQHAAKAGKGGAQHESEKKKPANVDADRLHHLGIIDSGANHRA